MDTSRRRDRHDRGIRGALAPMSIPLARTAAERFGDVVVSGLERLERRWPPGRGPVDLRTVEVAVEDVPVPPSHGTEIVLGELSPGPPPQLVVYRRPIEHRVETDAELAELVRGVLTELVAELFEMAPEDVDPDYE